MRKTRLVDCNPNWAEFHGVTCYVSFDCPEGHVGCRHMIPFYPALDGSMPTMQGARWERSGDDFATLSLSPSIKRTPSYESYDAAIAAGCIPEHVTPSLLCALHINIVGGQINFCVDSR
jgi:hypothetical protein